MDIKCFSQNGTDNLEKKQNIKMENNKMKNYSNPECDMPTTRVFYKYFTICQVDVNREIFLLTSVNPFYVTFLYFEKDCLLA